MMSKFQILLVFLLSILRDLNYSCCVQATRLFLAPIRFSPFRNNFEKRKNSLKQVKSARFSNEWKHAIHRLLAHDVAPLPEELEHLKGGAGWPGGLKTNPVEAMKKTTDLLMNMTKIRQRLDNTKVTGVSGGQHRPKWANKLMNSVTTYNDSANVTVTLTGTGKPVGVELNDACFDLSKQTLQEYISEAMLDAWYNMAAAHRDVYASFGKT